jgi:hypothetical protein
MRARCSSINLGDNSGPAKLELAVGGSITIPSSSYASDQKAAPDESSCIPTNLERSRRRSSRPESEAKRTCRGHHGTDVIDPTPTSSIGQRAGCWVAIGDRYGRRPRMQEPRAYSDDVEFWRRHTPPTVAAWRASDGSFRNEPAEAGIAQRGVCILQPVSATAGAVLSPATTASTLNKSSGSPAGLLKASPTNAEVISW